MPFDGERHGGLDVRLDRDVAAQELLAQLAGQIGARGIDVDEHHVPAELGEQPGDPGAYPGRGTGYHGDLSGTRHRLPLSHLLSDEAAYVSGEEIGVWQGGPMPGR